MVRVTAIELMDRLFLIGPPGIGKTEIIKQKAIEEARKKGKIFVDLREASNKDLEDIMGNPDKYYVYYRIIATHLFPEDLGIPRERSDWIEFLPPKVLKILSTDDIEGVLFIDELSNVQRDDQISMLYSIIQEKEASWIVRFSRRIKIVAAGNPSEWSEIVRSLPKPLRSRLTIINVDPPTVDEWIKYMEEKYGDQWDRFVAIYLKMYPEDFIKTPDEEDENYPCPRNWTELSILLYQFKNKEDLKEEIIIGRLGKRIGSKFIGVLRTDFDAEKVARELIRNPEKIKELRLEKKILVLNYISQRSLEELNEYRKFMEYLLKNEREMFMVLLMSIPRNRRVIVFRMFKDLLGEAAKIFGSYE